MDACVLDGRNLDTFLDDVQVDQLLLNDFLGWHQRILFWIENHGLVRNEVADISNWFRLLGWA